MNTSIDIESVRRLVSEREPGSPIELKNRSFENMDLSGWNLRNIDFSGSDFTSVSMEQILTEQAFTRRGLRIVR